MSNEKEYSINYSLIKSLVCPVTGGNIYYDKKTNALVSKAAKLSFPVKNGIPILIRSEAKPLFND